MGGVHTERKRISCLCDENSIELRTCANYFRNGSINASQYEASPFMRERSSHKARNEDI